MTKRPRRATGLPGGVMRRCLAVVLFTAILCGAFVLGATPISARSRHPAAAVTPNPPVVIPFSIIPASRGAAILRSVYPNARITLDAHANAVIVVAPIYEEDGMRTIASGIDVKNPTDTTVDSYQLKVLQPTAVAARLAGIFPQARFVVAPDRTIVILASPSDMEQIKSIVTAIDTAPPTPSPRPRYPAEAVRVTQRNPKRVARAVAAESPGVRIAVSGSEILLSGPQDALAHAKALIAQLDVPQMGSQFTQLYRVKYVDASSVADLFRRSFPNLTLYVDSDLNAITVRSNLTMQRRIADALAQLDVAPPGTPGAGGESGGPASSGVDVVSLKAAVPGLQGGPSTSATDIANTVTQALQATAPDLHIVVPPNSTELVLTGSPYSIKLAKELIAKLDKPQPLVALDTEVLEVDVGAERQLGLKLNPAALTTTYTEIAPVPPLASDTNPSPTAPPITGFLPWTRTPLSFTAQLDLLISQNKARVLEDPRITTISGRTASLRAGETVNILTTTGGGTGTVATTQVQSFQTGVTLDITPIVNSNDYITVTLHPSVNTEAGISAAGVPNIQTRDTTTTVGLRDGQTIVIGGLIEDEDTRTIQKIPILGDLPLIGRFFQDRGVTHARNELIVTVTPHIVRPGEEGDFGPPHMRAPQPGALPTLPPGTQLPPPRSASTNAPFARPSPAPEPQPVSVPTPAAMRAAAAHAAIPVPATQVSAASQPAPAAFAKTDVYTFGSPPQNNYAADNAAAQIFYVQVAPSVVRNAQPMTIAAITTTNVVKLTFGSNAVIPMTTLKNVGAGQWQASFPFSAAGLPAGQSSVTLLLTATTAGGATVSLPIPLSLVTP